MEDNNNETLALAAPETALDAFYFTVRGQPYDEVVDALLAALPPSATYLRKSKELSRPKLAYITVEDDNPVVIRFDSIRNDLYISVNGPLGQNLQNAARAIDAAYPPHPATAWTSSARVNRIDAKLDVCFPGAFDEITAKARAIQSTIPTNRRPKFTPYGTEEDGRTAYFGNLKYRTVLIRIYEKGKQLLGKGVDADPNLVRIEVESHPDDAAAFDALYWEPIKVISTSFLACALIHTLGHALPSFTPSRDSGTRSPTVRKLGSLHRQYAPLFWELARRFDSTEAAARTIAAVLLQANPQPQRLQKMLDKGISAPELQADLFGWNVATEQHPLVATVYHAGTETTE